MTWKLTEKGRRVEPITGVPWQEMSDAEFERVIHEYDKQFSDDQKGSLKRSGFFEHVPTAEAKESK